MASIINKVKEKVAEIKADHQTSGSTNAGPHDSNVANKADPRIDSDLDGRGVGHHNHGTGVTGHNNHGTGVTGASGIGSSGANTTTGPHNSNILNKADPRVDSDLSGGHVGSNAAYTTTGNTGTTGGGYGNTGSSGYNTTGTGVTGTSGIGSSGANTTAGPHSSNILNKADPRVDSDLSGGHLGSNAAYTTTGNTGSSGYNTTGTGGGYGNTGSSGYNTTGAGGFDNRSTNAGPHDSNIANKVDPRVDSNLDGSRNAGMNQTTHSGHHGHHHGHNDGHVASHNAALGTAGTGYANEPVHNNQTLNKLDPRVTTTNTTTGATGGQYNTTTTSTEPIHNSNLLNKLDPRVDSNVAQSQNRY